LQKKIQLKYFVFFKFYHGMSQSQQKAAAFAPDASSAPGASGFVLVTNRKKTIIISKL
jgi:hypothetical protein